MNNSVLYLPLKESASKSSARPEESGWGIRRFPNQNLFWIK